LGVISSSFLLPSMLSISPLPNIPSNFPSARKFSADNYV
jgi:hypothetical protein